MTTSRHPQALRYFALDGAYHLSQEEQNSMFRRYITWRNRNAKDEALREVITRRERCLTRH